MARFDIIYRVVKFSHALGSDRDDPIAWKHDDKGGVIVAITGDEQPNGSLYMKVTKEANTLESVDLASYIDKAIQAHRAASQLRIDQLPIFGITKDLLLGIRYKVDGMTRRLQLRMQSATQCRQLVEMFRRRGMEVQDQRPSTARPATAGPRPDTACSDTRPLTAQSTSTHFQRQQGVPKPNLFRLTDIQVGSLSQQSALQFESNMSPPQVLLCNDTTSAGVFKPSSAQLSRAQTPHKRLGPQTLEIASVSASDARGDTLPHRTDSYGSSSNVNSDTTHHQSSGTLNSSVLGVWSSDPAEPRPNTAVSTTFTTFPLPGTLEHEIPPRRELPFKRPVSRKSDANGGSSRPGSSRPGSSALSLPPLQMPKMTRPQSQAASPQKAAKSVGEVEPPKLNAASCPEASAKKSALAGADTTRPYTPATQPRVTEASNEEAIPMRELLYGKKAFSGGHSSAQVPRVNSMMDAPHEIEAPPDATELHRAQHNKKAPGSPTPVASGLSTKTVTSAQVTSSNIQSSLQQYEGQSLQDRQAALENFMMEKLQDPAFTILCEDVENCWRRIALGL